VYKKEEPMTFQQEVIIKILVQSKVQMDKFPTKFNKRGIEWNK
jgi:hypothetical protein